MIPWKEITPFGDITVTAVAALAMTGWLMAEGEKRLAWWWSILFTAGMGIVITTKMAFIGWGIGIHSLDFTGLSGHAMRAMAVMPALCYLILQKAPVLLRMIGVLFGLGFGTLVSISRLMVNAHSVSEVISGWMLGLIVSGIFIWIASASQKPIFNPLRVALVVLALLPAPYVQPAPTQQWLTEFTLYFSGHDKPFLRTGWKSASPHSSKSHQS